MAKKNKRYRISPEQTKKNVTSMGGGGTDFINLPKGIERWEPDKAGTYNIDIVPYEVTKTTNHDQGIKPCAIHWRRMFTVHKKLGPDSQTVVCPRENGEKCAKCDYIDMLKKEYVENKDTLKALWKNDQRIVIYNILNPDDPEEIMVMCYSYGKMDKKIGEELAEEGGEWRSSFYDIIDGNGKTLKTRFTKKTYEKSDYLEATKIDFKDRDDMDEDEILNKTVDLDAIINTASEEEMSDLFDEKEYDDDDENEEEEEKPATRRKKKKFVEKEEELDTEEEIEDEIEDEEEEEIQEPVKPAKKKKAAKKEVVVEDDDDDDDWDDEEE